MVSFCCDQCQEVVKKPKIEKHFFTCRTRSVSCVDCGKTFDRAGAASHISCITEKEKYEKQQVPKPFSQRLEGDTDTYCKTCNVAFNSALQGEQHYQSKRHASAVKRRLENENASGASTNNATAQTENNGVQETMKSNGHAISERNKKQNSSNNEEKSCDRIQAKQSSRQKKIGLKKAIKKHVASKGIRLHSLLKKLQKEGFSSDDLEKRVREKVKKSRKLYMDGKRIKLKN